MKTEKEIEEYISFMYNPENVGKCDACPENKGYDDWQDRKPCGQWDCWVAVHCRMEGKVIK